MNSITDKDVHNPNMSQANLEYFRDFLQKHGSAESAIDSYLTSVRYCRPLFCDITVEYLQEYKVQLMEHYKPYAVDTRIRGINQYVVVLQAAFTGENTGPAHGESSFFVLPETLSLLTPYKPPSVRHQQKPFLDNAISKRDYECLKRCSKRDNNMFWYLIVRFLGATGAGVSELMQIEVEHVQVGCIDPHPKGRKVRRIYFPERLCGEILAWLALCGMQTGFIFTNRRGRQITPCGISSQLKVLARHYRIRPDTIYPHSFRHRFAEDPLTKFNDVSLLAGPMEHESVETTRIYLTYSPDEQRVLIDKIVTWQTGEWPHVDCILHRNPV